MARSPFNKTTTTRPSGPIQNNAGYVTELLKISSVLSSVFSVAVVAYLSLAIHRPSWFVRLIGLKRFSGLWSGFVNKQNKNIFNRRY